MKYDVKISNLKPDGSIKAFASVNLNNEFAITGVKVMEGAKGRFVSMPSYKTAKGYNDVCFPITKEARQEFNDAVISAYEMAISQLLEKPQATEEMPTQSKEMTM